MRVVTAALALTLALSPHLAGADRPSGLAEPQTVQLDIPARQQWDEFHGYCGECSIQQAALYYGAYVSQFVCRDIVSPTQRKEVLVGVNEDVVLDALRFNFEQFPYRLAPTPQYQNYLAWIKRHLHAGHPTLFVAYAQGGHDPDYDHILLATGCTSIDFTTYHPDDRLFYNDNYARRTLSRPFNLLPDSRYMLGNGEFFEFCVPVRVDYGCAVTGIQDDTGEALPVQVAVDRSTEPNVPLGQDPVQLNATVRIGGLQPGQPYVLYRYDDYRNVPTRNYAQSRYSSARLVLAADSSAVVADQILSSGAAIYRCLPPGR